MKWIYPLLERDLLPDGLIRLGIRRLLAERLRQAAAGDPEARHARLLAELSASPLALATDTANEQHYEVPTEFFRHVLGRRLKYSSAYWNDGCRGLDSAEEAMLELYLSRAELVDGQDILELGCGWGSLSFFMAERLPDSRISVLTHSRTQKDFIEHEAARRGHRNLQVIHSDMNDFATAERFDRVVSIEMFEHMRNYAALLHRIAEWLHPGGKLFVHIFCHHRYAYPFEVRDASDWMARYFFTGGLMPSADLLLEIESPLGLEERWMVDGRHYQRTSRAWLENMDRRRQEILPLLEQVYGAAAQRRWWVYWRVFFMACEELFGYRGGEEWQVAHYRFVRP